MLESLDVSQANQDDNVDVGDGAAGDDGDVDGGGVVDGDGEDGDGWKYHEDDAGQVKKVLIDLKFNGQF